MRRIDFPGNHPPDALRSDCRTAPRKNGSIKKFEDVREARASLRLRTDQTRWLPTCWLTTSVRC